MFDYIMDNYGRININDERFMIERWEKTIMTILNGIKSRFNL